jgi:hypothetical protein
MSDSDEECDHPFTSYATEGLETEPATLRDSVRKPDKAKAARFLTLLDPGATFFTFQTFDDDKERKDPKLARVLHGTLDNCWGELVRQDERGAGAFLTVNETDRRGRSRENIIRVRALFVDLDGAPLENVDRLGLEPTVVVGTSAGRYHVYWRVEGVELSEFSGLQRRLISLMGGDTSVHDLPRVMRLPGFPHQKDRANPQPVRVRSAGGASYDIGTFRAALEVAEQRFDRADADEPDDMISWRNNEPVDFDELESAVLSLPIKGLDYDTWLKVGMSLHYETRGDERGLELFDRWSAGDPERYSERVVREKWHSFRDDKDSNVTGATILYLARERGWRSPRDAAGDDGRMRYPAPRGDSERLPIMLQIDEALARSEETFPPMRDMNGAPITITERTPLGLHELTSDGANDDEAVDLRRPAAAAPTLTLHDFRSLALEIERYARFDRVMKRGKSCPVALPAEFIKTYMGYRTSRLPRVGALLTLPLVLPDGRLIFRTGLHRELNLAMQTDERLAKRLASRAVTAEDAARALRYLTDDWLVDVSTSYAGKCVLVAAALTVIERPLFKARPCFWVTAGKRAGGKTTAINMIAAATAGAHASATAWSTNEEERRKALFSALLQAPPLLVFDNIPSGWTLSCPHVERALTSAALEDRILGKSEVRCAPTSTVIVFTGNNIGPKGDLASRSLVTRIEVERPDPENREFKRTDPIGWTLANRADVLAALYTILRAPRAAAGKTRFKEWHEVIGARLERAAEMNGERLSFADLFAEAQAADEEESSLGEALQVLQARFKDDPFTAAEVAALFDGYGPTDGAYSFADLADAETLKDGLTPDARGRPTKRAISWGLKKMVGAPTQIDDGGVLTLRKNSRDDARVLTFKVQQS